MKRLSAKLTYANVISTLCLILLVGGGTAYAATEMLPNNSVGSKQIKKEAVTPAKLSKASKATLTGPAGATGATGAAGPQGPEGAKGAEGQRGLEGPSGKASDLFATTEFTFVNVEAAGNEVEKLTFTPTASGEAQVVARGYCNIPTSETEQTETDLFFAESVEEAVEAEEYGKWGVIRLPPQADAAGAGIAWSAQETVQVQAGVPQTVRLFGDGQGHHSNCGGTITVLGLF